MDDKCPKCGAPLSPINQTASGKQLQRCSNGNWNKDTRKNEGCDYVKWLAVEPQILEEKCPKCNASLVLVVTRFGKKMKKCSTNTWNKDTKKSEGCDYIEWINGTTEQLDEDCPECGSRLVLYTTAAGKKMKKCSTSGWDKVNKVATGCTFVQWLKPGDFAPQPDSGGEENLPPDPNA